MPSLKMGLAITTSSILQLYLSQLGEDSEQDLRLLLIEEPEAHLHPQMQQVLADALIEASKKDQPEGVRQSQVIVTSHSPLLASHFPVDKVIGTPRSQSRAAKTREGNNSSPKG